MFIRNIERVHGGPRLDAARAMAIGLGVFSIAFGVFELAAPGRLAQWLGLKSHKPLLRGYGAREVATGAGIFGALGTGGAHWPVWGRVAGDASEIATLAVGFRSSKRKLNVLIALGAVAAVTALDVVCAVQLTRNRRHPKKPVRDYARRTGFPRGVEAAYGVAARELAEGVDWWNAWRRNKGRGGTDRIIVESRRAQSPGPEGAARRRPPDYGVPAGQA